MAGESAQREYERIRDQRREARRQHLPILAGVTGVAVVVLYAFFEWSLGAGHLGAIIAIMLVLPRALAPSRREVAWRRGAEGERIVGGALDALSASGILALHDRRIPRSPANIDHVAVGRHAVYTVDAKRYRGRIVVRGERLFVAGRDRSKLVAQARRQREVVRAALVAGGFRDVPVLPVLCFAGAEWPLLFPPRRAGDVRLCSPKGLSRALDLDGPQLPTSHQHAILELLDRSLVPVTRKDPSRAEGVDPPRDPSAAPDVTAGQGGVTPSLPSVVPPAPICRCGAVMVERRRRRDGSRFLGCSTFPACRRTRPIPGEV